MNEISVSPVGSFGRTFIFPDVSPDAFAASKDATPTGPVLYLSWPAWENFRLRRLGQSPPTEGLTPIMTADPPNFAASLAAMREAAQDGTPVPTPPMRPEDSAESIKRDLLGRAGGGLPTQETSSDPLILALWSAARSMAREAAELMAEASAKRRELFERLRDDGTESVPVEGQSDFGEIPSPSAARSLRRAWVRLAAPLLRPEDRLLPTRPEFRPDESEPEFAEDPPGSGLLIWLPAAGAAGGGR